MKELVSSSTNTLPAAERWIRTASTLMKLAGIVCWAICIVGLVLAAMTMHGLGAELSISGNCSGIGAHVMEIEGISLENMTFEEAVYVLGPAHNFNISRDGLLTFENGSSWQITASGAI